MFSTRIKEYIKANDLIGDNDKVIVGLSGGADSVALLSVLREIGYDCVAAHCNFHLRGDESNRDERHCTELCAHLDIPLVVRHFDVSGHRARTGESVEMACRTLRYEWWNHLIANGEGSLLAVGHHREDNIETFFINLFRGCGLAGLKGMLPRNGVIIRPLLDASRDDIESYLCEKQLDFVTDSTNLEDDFRRNKIRLNILPLLNREFPGASDSISRTIDNLRGNFSLYEEHIANLQAKYIDPSGIINVKSLVETSPHPATALYEIASPLGLNSSRTTDIVKSVKNGSAGGKLFDGFLLDRGRLYPPTPAKNASVALTTEIISVAEFYRLRDSRTLDRNTLYLDADTIDNSFLTIRPWHAGDRIAPFGMKGTRLVSDILSDAKLSLSEKGHVRIIEYQGRILWIAGIRASRHFPVTATTTNVLTVKITEK